MKRVLKMIGGFVAVVATVSVLSGSAQARTFVSVNVGFPLFYGPSYYSTGYCYPYAYSRPVYCYPRAAYYYRPYCGPSFYYSGGSYYRCR